MNFNDVIDIVGNLISIVAVMVGIVLYFKKIKNKLEIFGKDIYSLKKTCEKNDIKMKVHDNNTSDISSLRNELKELNNNLVRLTTTNEESYKKILEMFQLINTSNEEQNLKLREHEIKLKMLMKEKE